MFQSYSFKFLDFDQKSKNWSYEILIVDEDFQEMTPVIMGSSNIAGAYSASIMALVKIYSKRNLNVYKNIIKLMQYHYERNGDDINKQIQWYKKDVEGFDKYLPELEKYLLLE